MKWENDFSDLEVNAGQEIIKNGRVELLQCQNDSCQYELTDPFSLETYQVTLEGDFSQEPYCLTAAACTCSAGQKTGHCGHIAACLMDLESDGSVTLAGPLPRPMEADREEKEEKQEQTETPAQPEEQSTKSREEEKEQEPEEEGLVFPDPSSQEHAATSLSDLLSGLDLSKPAEEQTPPAAPQPAPDAAPEEDEFPVIQALKSAGQYQPLPEEFDSPSPSEDEDAALLGTLPQLEKLYDAERTRASQSAPASPRYFDTARILQSVDPSTPKIQAQLLRQEKKLGPLGVRIAYQMMWSKESEGIQVARSTQNVITANGSEYPVALTVSRDRVLQARCSVPNCKGTPAGQSKRLCLCVHAMASLYALTEMLDKKKLGDYTDLNGRALMQRLNQEEKEKEKEASAVRPEQALQLGATLILSQENEALLSFFLFRDGPVHPLADPLGFARAARGSRADLEKSDPLYRNFDPAQLNADSRDIFGFLCELADDYLFLASQVQSPSRGKSLPQKQALPLSPGRLDAFFERRSGKQQTVRYIGRDFYLEVERNALFAPGLPLAQIEIRPYTPGGPQDFQGITLSGSSLWTFASEKYLYGFDDSLDAPRLTRTELERGEVIRSLQEITHSRSFSLTLGIHNLASFYQNMLPGLKEAAVVTEYQKEKITPYLPSPPSFAAFLDVCDGRVLCRARAVYATESYDVHDSYSGELPQGAVRDRKGESSFAEQIEQYFPYWEPEKKVYWAQVTDPCVLDLLSSGLAELMKTARVMASPSFRRLRVPKNAKPALDLSLDPRVSMLDLQLGSSSLDPEDLLQALQAYRLKKTYTPLKEGGFLVFSQNPGVGELSDLLEKMGIPLSRFVEGKMDIPAYRTLYIEKMLEEREGLYIRRDQNVTDMIRDFSQAAEAESSYKVPASLEKVLRGYQKAGYQWLRALDRYGFGGILADEMGLGKTVQVIAVMLAYREEHPEEHLPSLVICPASLVYNWGEEFRKFAPGLKVSLIAGNKYERQEQLIREKDSDVLVTSYDLAKRDVDTYAGLSFRYLVIDEAQYIKNPVTVASRTVRLIPAKTRYALTGTPIENRLTELWSIMDFLMPGIFYTREQFRRSFEVPISRGDDPAEERMDQLRRMSSSFILRRLKTDVLKDLPDKIEEVLTARFDAEQQRVYSAETARMLGRISAQSDREFQKSRIEVLAELMRLRRICCDPSLVYENYGGGSAKREVCMELVRDLAEGGHKVLIFSQFTTMLELLEMDLQEEGLSYYKLTGATPKMERIQMVSAFNSDDTPVFLASLRAGGTGLNLTGADAVIHYDPWWNLAVQNQATDRVHRIGQTKVVTVYQLVCKDTIEERILALQKTKAKLAEDILSDEGVSSASLSREDLMSLLEIQAED